MITFIAALAFAIVWGIGENRFFREEGEWYILNHWKTYHVFLGVLILLVAISGAESSLLKFLFILVWTPLMLDVTWWLIRYYEITYCIVNTYGEPNAWHLPTDWDAMGLPLWFGTYSWWWILIIICAVLGALIVTVA